MFPAQVDWKNSDGSGYAPVLEFSLTPTESAGTISRSDLINNTFNVFLYPESDSGSYTTGAPNNSTQVGYAPGQQVQIVPGNCGQDSSTTYPCSVTITGLGGGSNFVLHYLNFYDSPNIYITGNSSQPGNPTVNFIGQDQIDVTGQAHNVLKRLNATLSAQGSNGQLGDAQLPPGYSLEAQNICKREQTAPVTLTNHYGTDFISPSGNNVNIMNDPCDLDY
jgi:hypothetical protein